MCKTYSLGIRIDGNKITDDEAKIITLLMHEAVNEEIEQATYIKKSIIYNTISDLYHYLEIEEKVYILVIRAMKSGFDFQFKYKGKDIFTPEELARVYEKIPRLLKEETELILTIRKKH